MEEWGAAGWVQVLVLEAGCPVVRGAASSAPAASPAPAAVQPGNKQGGGKHSGEKGMKSVDEINSHVLSMSHKVPS